MKNMKNMSGTGDEVVIIHEASIFDIYFYFFLHTSLHLEHLIHQTAIHFTTQYYTTQKFATFHQTTLHYTTLNYTTLHYTTLPHKV